MIQDFFTSFGICLRMLNGVELSRILSDACKCGTFRKVQIPHIFIKILPCRCLNAVGACSQVDGIQIIFKDHVFVIDLLFNLNCQILLLEFTCEPFQPGGFLGPVGKYIIFQKLLGNGTGTLGETSGSDIFYESTEDTSYVDSVVLVKTFILNSNYRMLQIHRNLFDGNRQSVGAWRSQLTQLVSVYVIQKGCISQRRNIHVICIRGIIYDSPKGPDAQTAYNHTERDQRYEQNSDKRNVCTFSHHGCTGNQRISLF